MSKAPFCTCKWGELANVARCSHASYNVTETDDGETCKFCGYYVHWKDEDKIGNQYLCKNSDAAEFSDEYVKRKEREHVQSQVVHWLGDSLLHEHTLDVPHLWESEYGKGINWKDQNENSKRRSK